ncbi:MAG TPA: citrate transporter [Burkholderiales bacterium]|nr:citrate transporter [Burkholderiales bacterium]
MLSGIPPDFLLFALTLLGVAVFHRHTLLVALLGLFTILAYKLAVTGFDTGPGVAGLLAHLEHEWVILSNLFALLVGFALLSAHFHDSGVPDLLPRFLPDDWKGGFVLLVMVFVLSSFLDNIAAAVIGGTVASSVFRGKVHVGYLAAIVAASNAGGSGSVIGDTTTTMMWIAGVDPLLVLDAYIAAGTALLFLGVFAARQQQRHAPISADPQGHVRVDWVRLGIVVFLLGTAVAANVVVNVEFPQAADRFPFIGAAIWVALLASAPLRRPDWRKVPPAARGSVFLLSLVLAASLMPVEKLPPASWQSALGLGYVSAVFDNIPLTALALKQGGHDWGMLAYAVGFGGSMIWFGSSAGVALSSQFPESRSVFAWVRHGWHVAVAYPLGFFALLWVLGWHADAHPGRPGAVSPAKSGAAMPENASPEGILLAQQGGKALPFGSPWHDAPQATERP